MTIAQKTENNKKYKVKTNISMKDYAINYKIIYL